MKPGTIMQVLFCNDTPLKVYGALNDNQQKKVLDEVKKEERTKLRQIYGTPSSINPRAEQEIADLMGRWYFHFHEVPFAVIGQAEVGIS